MVGHKAATKLPNPLLLPTEVARPLFCPASFLILLPAVMLHCHGGATLQWVPGRAGPVNVYGTDHEFSRGVCLSLARSSAMLSSVTCHGYSHAIQTW